MKNAPALLAACGFILWSFTLFKMGASSAQHAMAAAKPISNPVAMTLAPDVKEYIDTQCSRVTENSCPKVPQLLARVDQLEDHVRQFDQLKDVRSKLADTVKSLKALSASQAKLREAHLKPIRAKESLRLTQEIIPRCAAEGAKHSSAESEPSSEK